VGYCFPVIFVTSNELKKQIEIMKKSTLVCTLAAQLRKNKPSYDQSTAMLLAWIIVKQDLNKISLLTFKKIDGTICTRVVSTEWFQYHAITGGGRPVKEGLKLFADLGKHYVGRPCIISAYEQNIISLAA
jgi:hypothetical protein